MQPPGVNLELGAAKHRGFIWLLSWTQSNETFRPARLIRLKDLILPLNTCEEMTLVFNKYLKVHILIIKFRVVPGENIKETCWPLIWSYFIFFPLPYCPLFPARSPLSLISAPTGSHNWGLETRWAQLLITSNYFLSSKPKVRSRMRARLTE